jgi:hypothetical protein
MIGFRTTKTSEIGVGTAAVKADNPRLWFQSDFAAYFTRAVRSPLDATICDRCFASDGTVSWPPPSPDLALPDFLHWCHLNSLIYEAHVETDEVLAARSLAACENIQNRTRVFERVRQNMARSCNDCKEVGGRQFEDLL